VSGPLASYIAHHSKAGPVGRAVLVQLALTCNHDGSPSRYVATWADLEHRTGYSRRAVAKGLREVEGLEEAAPDRRGGGRGKATPYRLNVALCDPVDRCWACRTLAEALQRNGAPGAPFRAGKGARHDRNGAPGAPTTETPARTLTRETESQRYARLAARRPKASS
jgi:hypothetical protein